MVLFFRRGHATERSSEPFAPFLWTENAALLTGYAGKTEIVELAGDNPLKYLVRFPSWKEFQKATSWLRKTSRLPSLRTT